MIVDLYPASAVDDCPRDARCIDDVCTAPPEDGAACEDWCRRGSVCLQAICRPASVNGAPCTVADACLGGACVDGVCGARPLCE